MKTVLVFLSIMGAIAAFTLPQNDPEQIKFPTKISQDTDPSIKDYGFLGTVHVKDHKFTFLTGTVLIVNERWVLTSATSVYTVLPENLEVRLDSSFANQGGLICKVKKLVIHPNFNIVSWENDLALLELTEDLVFTGTIAPFYSASSEPQAKSTAVLLGFGTGNVLPDPQPLKSVKVTISKSTRQNSTKGNTDMIFIESQTSSGPSIANWGSPLIVDGLVLGTYIGDVPSPVYHRSTTNAFVDLTKDDVWNWIFDVTESSVRI